MTGTLQKYLAPEFLFSISPPFPYIPFYFIVITPFIIIVIVVTITVGMVMDSVSLFKVKYSQKTDTELK